MRNIDLQSKISKLRQAISVEENGLTKAHKEKKSFEQEMSNLRRTRTRSVLQNRIRPVEALQKQRKLNTMSHRLSDIKQQIKKLQINIDHDKRDLSTLYTLQNRIKGGDTQALYQAQNLIWHV